MFIEETANTVFRTGEVISAERATACPGKTRAAVEGLETPILAVEELRFGYSSREILQGVSFEVYPGEICALLGANGCGKTTLLKCLNGLLKPRIGQIRLGGDLLSRMSRLDISAQVAAVPQELHTVFPFSVMEMVLMGGNARYGFRSLPKESDRRQARDVLADLGMEYIADRRFNELSGGERQMVLIARALFQKTPILLLDEPISHLDFKRQHLILETVRRITRERGLTSLITLHDPNAAARYCDRLVMLNGGKILQKGLCDDVFDTESLEAIYDMKIHIDMTESGTRYVTPAC